MRAVLCAVVVVVCVACGSATSIIRSDAGPDDAGVAGGGGGAMGGGGGAMGGGGGATGGGGGSDAGVALNGADQCASAPDVTSGGTFVGTTTGQTDDYGPSLGNGCPSGGLGSGRDVAYRLAPSVMTNYTVRVQPLNSSFDPMLYVQASCGVDQCVTGTVLNGPGLQESVTFSVAAGQTVYVIVDGENVSNGPFELTVQP